MHSVYMAFHIGARNLNSGLHALAMGSSPTGLSPYSLQWSSPICLGKMSSELQ